MQSQIQFSFTSTHNYVKMPMLCSIKCIQSLLCPWQTKTNGLKSDVQLYPCTHS